MAFTPENAINKYVRAMARMGPYTFPYLVSSNKEELLACRESAWIGSCLCQSPTYNVTGPDAAKLLNYVSVNRDFNKLKLDGSRHALMCNEKGQMLADGLITRLDENTFRTYWLAPVIEFYVETLGMNVKGNYVMDEYFYQIDGPKSLEIVEKACQCDLHDMKFAAQKKVKICNTDMMIVRLGMSGCLGYEVHGPIGSADIVFEKLLSVGAEFGAKQLGNNSYCNNHTQGGYPNQFIHYWYPYFSSGEALAKFIAPRTYVDHYVFGGSCNDDENNYFVTPYDVDWDYLIKYDHDFIGRAALEQIAKNPPSKVVTLEWDADDVGFIFASQFKGKGVEPYDDISKTGDNDLLPMFNACKVLLDGKVIGRTSGRTHDYYHRREISLAFIDRKQAVEGKEVKILWGTNGTPQKEIKAKIAAFPYYNEEYRNETFDVEKIPHPKFN
jgi:glycine cleavage system aminomethyltransferase T